MTIVEIFFSPSGTTQKVADHIAGNFDGKKENCNLLIYNGEKELESDDVAIVAMPVFAGRIPKTARERLSKIKANDTPAIAVVNYGNAHVSDSLLELVELLKENEFNVIAAASTVSHHSIFDGVAVGRPDSSDLEKIDEFSKRCMEKIESEESLSCEIPGNRPYVDYKQLPFVIGCDETLCAFCYDCVSICPEQAIAEDDPIETDLDSCSRCTACISICPEDARSFIGDAFEAKKPEFEKANAERKEPEFYL
ncbi:ferredoxin [Methanobrevibacter sp.]|uniref:ferredoxin n=1 Tax=Methanobrevibacter sp. TaxID=66852 RepID=UPI0025DC2325|nr:ferredoxin [Methanobrevibacter sp.]MBQ2666548.1 4Fe-4S dicluster domain-containing protein [Methanobrevibacter sp.]